MTERKLSAYELYVQAGGDRTEYRRLLLEHGLLIPLKPGEVADPLPCGWPKQKTEERTDEERPDGHGEH